MHILADGVVLRTSLLLALLIHGVESFVCIREDCLDLAPLLFGQLKLLRELIDKGNPVRTPIHSPGEHRAETSNEAS